jgi:1,4-dihydroxy-2-naphthoate octaprenyltransferase
MVEELSNSTPSNAKWILRQNHIHTFTADNNRHKINLAVVLNNETITIFMKLFIYFAFMLFIGAVLCKES